MKEARKKKFNPKKKLKVGYLFLNYAYHYIL